METLLLIINTTYLSILSLSFMVDNIEYPNTYIAY